MPKPKLSIVIPIFNGKEFIKRSLDSIYNQNIDFNKFEVICVDDCSSDIKSLEALNQYRFKSERPSNLKIIQHETNKRQGGARNTGIKNASGEYIMFLDVDDYLEPSSLFSLIDEIEKNECRGGGR